MNTYHPMRVFVIPMRLPGLNEYIDAERTHRQKAAKLKRLVQRDISACILDQLGGAAYDCPVDIEYTWYEPDRRRDKDNIAFAKKFINDALVACGVLPNDGWRNIHKYILDDLQHDDRTVCAGVNILPEPDPVRSRAGEVEAQGRAVAVFPPYRAIYADRHKQYP